MSSPSGKKQYFLPVSLVVQANKNKQKNVFSTFLDFFRWSKEKFQRIHVFFSIFFWGVEQTSKEESGVSFESRLQPKQGHQNHALDNSKNHDTHVHPNRKYMQNPKSNPPNRELLTKLDHFFQVLVEVEPW